MNNKKQTLASLRPGANSLLMITVMTLAFACQKSKNGNTDLKDFKQINLVANTSEYRPATLDPTLINGFGLAWSPNGSTAWVNSVGGHVSELYSREGLRLRGVTIPSPDDSTGGGLPCGIVFSGGKGFNLPNGPSVFLFAGFDGVLSGWNGALGNNAKLIKNPPRARYTGLAIASSKGRNLIYGANFAANKIDVWDTTFSLVNIHFNDPSIPPGYSPYNIQAVGDSLYVIYAKLGADQHPVPGAGSGYVRVFTTDGRLAMKFASTGKLNAPWGVTMAPGSFLQDDDVYNEEQEDYGGNSVKTSYGGGSGNQGNRDPKDPVIFVGNFGDGYILVYSLKGDYLGKLSNHKHPIEIEGLWALSFPPASTGVGIDASRLYFTAGPDHENDGLFGYLFKN